MRREFALGNLVWIIRAETRSDISIVHSQRQICLAQLCRSLRISTARFPSMTTSARCPSSSTATKPSSSLTPSSSESVHLVAHAAYRNVLKSGTPPLLTQRLFFDTPRSHFDTPPLTPGRYLDNRYPSEGQRLLPEDPLQRYRVRQFF